MEHEETYRKWLQRKRDEVQGIDDRVNSLQREIETRIATGAAREANLQPLRDEINALGERRNQTLEQISNVKRQLLRDQPAGGAEAGDDR